MICWRCSRHVAEDQAACPHCSSTSSQVMSAGSDEVGVQVNERVSEIQPSARWEVSAPSTYQEVAVAIPRDTGLVWGGFWTIIFGVVGFFGGAGGIIFGVIAIICGILTLTVSRFGARPRGTLSGKEAMLIYPGMIIARVILFVVHTILKIIASVERWG